MTKAEKVAQGVTLFAEKEILPALEGWKLWTAGAALLLAQERSAAILKEFAGSKTAVLLGVADAQGDIDVEAVGKALKQTARTHGSIKLPIPLFDIEFTLTESNVDTLISYING